MFVASNYRLPETPATRFIWNLIGNDAPPISLGYLHLYFKEYLKLVADLPVLKTALYERATEQNRSTEGCSKLKMSVGMTSSGKNGLNIRRKTSRLNLI